MSVEVKDFRKFVEDKNVRLAAEAEVKAHEDRTLLPQAVSDKASTGDDNLDKCLRVFQNTFNQLEAELPLVAEQAMGAIQPDLRTLLQLKWQFIHGKYEAYKEVMQVPAQVIMESKGKIIA